MLLFIPNYCVGIAKEGEGLKCQYVLVNLSLKIHNHLRQKYNLCDLFYCRMSVVQRVS